MTDDKFYTSPSANNIMAKLMNYVQQTRLITPSTDKHYSLDSWDVETSVTNNNSTTDTPGFKPFTIRKKTIVKGAKSMQCTCIYTILLVCVIKW